MHAPARVLRRPQEGAEEGRRLVGLHEGEHLLELIDDEQQRLGVVSEQLVHRIEEPALGRPELGDGRADPVGGSSG